MTTNGPGFAPPADVWSDPAAADDFLDAFDAFVRAVRRARGAGRRDVGGLTLSQYSLLEPLHDRNVLRVSELADAAGVTGPTATSILDTLERRGVVVRTTARADRRGVDIALTGSGRELLEERHAWLREQQRDLFRALAGDEQALAPGILEQLSELVDRLAAGPAA
jgi:MarR family transcriptional regulator for hemolysin